MLPDFEYHRARNIDEAIQLLAAYKGAVKILAGGTDLLLQMEQGNIWGGPCPNHLVSMRDITSLKYIRPENGDILVGANATHRDAELSLLVKKELSALHDAACQVGSVQIRNVATIAGNICNAAPSADTSAPLLALGAMVKAESPRGKRSIALSDFYRGPGQTVLATDEVVGEISIPRRPSLASSAYMKLSRRKAMDLALLGVAVYVCLEADENHVKEVRIALSTAAPTPIRACKAESVLKGVRLSDGVLNEAASAAATEASPRTSFRSTSEYRREMVRVLVRRSMLTALGRLRGLIRQS